VDSRGVEAYRQIIHAFPSRPPAPAVAANPSPQTTVAKPGKARSHRSIQTKPTNNSGKAKRKRQKFSKRERETTNPAMLIQGDVDK
jgi:hypothetical protein